MRKKILAFALIIAAFLGFSILSAPAASATPRTPMMGSWSWRHAAGIHYITLWDRSSIYWRVNTEASVWNSYLAVNNINTRFRYTTSPCSGVGCVTIDSSSSCLGQQVGGATAVFSTGVGTLNVANVTYYQCGSKAGTLTQQNLDSTTGHELGHVLGLDHHATTTGSAAYDMMEPWARADFKSWPTVDDMQGLKTQY